jgi:hypothetical protein
MHTHTLTHAHAYAHGHAHMHMHTHACTRTHMYTHTHVCSARTRIQRPEYMWWAHLTEVQLQHPSRKPAELHSAFLQIVIKATLLLQASFHVVHRGPCWPLSLPNTLRSQWVKARGVGVAASWTNLPYWWRLSLERVTKMKTSREGKGNTCPFAIVLRFCWDDMW